MSGEGGPVNEDDENSGGGGGGEINPPTPAVTYRPFEMADKDRPDLKVFEKGNGDIPKDPLTPLNADVIASITEDTKTNYVVENAPAAPVLDDLDAAPKDNAAVPQENAAALQENAAVNPADVEKAVELATVVQKRLEGQSRAGPVAGSQPGGRRRSKRRHPKKGSRKSKKGSARKSKKGGRSRKNGSKHRKHSRAHKKH